RALSSVRKGDRSDRELRERLSATDRVQPPPLNSPRRQRLHPDRRPRALRCTRAIHAEDPHLAREDNSVSRSIPSLRRQLSLSSSLPCRSGESSSPQNHRSSLLSTTLAHTAAN